MTPSQVGSVPTAAAPVSSADDRSIAANASVTFGAQLVGNAGFLVAALVVAHGLGPEGRGTLAFIIVSALVLARLGGIGIAESTLVFASQRPSLQPRLLSNAVLFALCGGALVGFLAAATLPGVMGITSGLRQTEALLLGVGTVAVAVFDATDHFARGCGRLRERSIVLAAVPWLYALVAAGFFLAGALSVQSAASVWLASNVLGAAALLAIVLRGIPFGAPSASLVAESIAFGIRAWVGNFATFVNLRIDQIILGLLATHSVLGIYAVAVNGSEVLLYLPTAVATALVPALARQRSSARQEQILGAFKVLLIATLASIALAVLLGPRLLPLVFGPAFEGSVGPFLWMLPGAVGFASTTVFTSALLASRSPGRSSLGPLASLVTGVTLDLLLIPVHGAVGAAVATSSAFIVGGAVALLLYRTQSWFPWSALVPTATDFANLRLAAALPGRWGRDALTRLGSMHS